MRAKENIQEPKIKDLLFKYYSIDPNKFDIFNLAPERFNSGDIKGISMRFAIDTSNLSGSDEIELFEYMGAMALGKGFLDHLKKTEPNKFTLNGLFYSQD